MSRTRPAAPAISQHNSSPARQPDGYTLFVTFGGVLTINPFLFNEMGFDPDKDFIPVTVLASAPYLLAVNPNGDSGQDRQGVHRFR